MAADRNDEIASNAVTTGSPNIAPSFSQIMAAMLRRWSTAAVLVCLVTTTPHAQRVSPITPQDLAQAWDAEHVSPPLPPLLEHDEVERRLQAIAKADPSRIAF